MSDRVEFPVERMRFCNLQPPLSSAWHDDLTEHGSTMNHIYKVIVNYFRAVTHVTRASLRSFSVPIAAKTCNKN